jgi:hypothetical protein
LTGAYIRAILFTNRKKADNISLEHHLPLIVSQPHFQRPYKKGEHMITYNYKTIAPTEAA